MKKRISNQELLENFFNLRDLFSDSDHWTKDISARDSIGNCLTDPNHPNAISWCLMGGIKKLNNEKYRNKPVYCGMITESMRRLLENISGQPILIINDIGGYVSVIQIIDRAIQSLKV